MTLSPEEWPAFAHLTFPHYARLLCGRPADSSIVAVGATHRSTPVGLALARRGAPDKRAEILSLFVDASCRGRGLGTRLLTEIEQRLRESRCPGAEVVYATPRPGQAALERVLTRCGWPPATGRMLLARATPRLLSAPCFRHRRVEGLPVCRWDDLPTHDRDQADRHPEVPEPLRPRQYEPGMHAATSLGLLDGGQVVGWVITHQVSASTLRYTALYVRRGRGRPGWGLSLVVAAAQRQLELTGPDSIGLFGVWLNNRRMVSFVRQTLAPFLASVQETRGTVKRYDTRVPDR